MVSEQVRNFPHRASRAVVEKVDDHAPLLATAGFRIPSVGNCRKCVWVSRQSATMHKLYVSRMADVVKASKTYNRDPEQEKCNLAPMFVPVPLASMSHAHMHRPKKSYYEDFSHGHGTITFLQTLLQTLLQT